MITHAGPLAEKNLAEYAANVGLDQAKFSSCLKSGRHKDRIIASKDDAASLKITGRPPFVIGKSTNDK